MPFSSGTDVVTNTYDEPRAGFKNVGHLTTALKATAGVTVASQTFDHDGEGNLVQRQWTLDGATHIATTGFAPGGEVLWKTYPDGDTVGSAATPFTYDLAGRLYAVPDTVSSTAYAADGQTSVIAYPNGVSTAFTYSPQRRFVTRIKTTKGAATLQQLDYARDDVGRITGVSSNRAGESWGYSYDSLDRLTLADNLTNPGFDRTFSYSLNGNMTSNSQLGTYFYPGVALAHPHAPNIAGPRTYTYDDNGNATSNGTQIYWDGENRLSSVTVGGATIVSLTYGPDGTR